LDPRDRLGSNGVTTIIKHGTIVTADLTFQAGIVT
jgi:hypothetical protein